MFALPNNKRQDMVNKIVGGKLMLIQQFFLLLIPYRKRCLFPDCSVCK
ncbi:hypothetical protein THIOSC15_1450003 [uncultured Thiomicrorhabdus sp.]